MQKNVFFFQTIFKKLILKNKTDQLFYGVNYLPDPGSISKKLKMSSDQEKNIVTFLFRYLD